MYKVLDEGPVSGCMSSPNETLRVSSLYATMEETRNGEMLDIASPADGPLSFLAPIQSSPWKTEPSP